MGRGFLILLASILTAAAVGAVDLNACGDKFLRIGRSPRYLTYAPVHPAAILVFAPANTKPSDAREYEEMLKRAGHRLQMVWTVPALVDALGASRYDIVISGVLDAPRLREHVGTAVAAPDLVPIVDRPSKARRAAIEREYPHFLDADWSRHEILAELDHVMQTRLTLAPPAGTR